MQRIAENERGPKGADLLSNPRKAGRLYRPREFFPISIFVANLDELSPYPPRLR
jgi:hypothetical protein